MSNWEQCKYLVSGALISLQLTDRENTFLYSDGFNSKNIVAENFSQNDNDFLGSLFFVVPTYEYNVQKKVEQYISERMKEKQLSQQNNEAGQSNQQEPKKKEAKKELIEEVKYAEELENEMKNNCLRLEKSKKIPIIYGEAFQLQHFRSKKFLSFQQENEMTKQQNNMILILDQSPSEQTIFKIVPAFKHQIEQSKDILFGEKNYLACDPDREAYVNQLTPRNYLDKSNNSGDFGLGLSDLDQQYMGWKDRSSEFFVGSEKKTQFRLLLFSASIEDDKQNQINFADILWISSHETSTYLECDEQKEESQQQQINQQDLTINQGIPSLFQQHQFNYSQMQTPFPQQQHNGDMAISQSQQLNIFNQRNILKFKEQKKKDPKNTIGMWKIEASSYSSGGVVKQNYKIRLRNLRNGYYLSVKPLSEIIRQPQQQIQIGRAQPQMQSSQQFNEVPYMPIMEKNISKNAEDSIFILEKVGEDGDRPIQNELMYENFFRVRHYKTGYYLVEQEEKALQQQMSGSQGQQQMAGFNQSGLVQENELEDQTDIISKYYMLGVKPVCPKSTVFKFYQAHTKEIYEMNFLLSYLPLVKNGQRLIDDVNIMIIGSIGSQNQEQLLRNGLKRLNQCLQDIKYFCYEEQENISDEIQQIQKINKSRQKILCEQGFMRHLARLLKKIKISRDFEKNSIGSSGSIQTNILAKNLNGPSSPRLPQQIDGGNKSSSLQQSQASVKKKNFFQQDQRTNLNDKKKQILELVVELGKTCYDLIETICKENPENQSECFLYFPIFKNHIGNQINAEMCMQSVLEQNDDLLRNIVFVEMNDDEELNSPERKKSGNIPAATASNTTNTSLSIRASSKLNHKENILQHRFKNNTDISTTKNTIIHIFLDKYIWLQKQMDQYQLQQQQQNQLQQLQNQQASQRSLSLQQIKPEKQTQQEKQQLKQILDFLNAVTKFEDTGITLNQSLIQHLLWKDEFKQAKLDEVTIKKLLNGTESDEVKGRQLIQYANLCFGRNYQCRDQIVKILRYDEIYEYMKKQFCDQQEKLVGDNNILDAVIQIVDCVYIDMNPRIEQKVPQLIYQIVNVGNLDLGIPQQQQQNGFDNSILIGQLESNKTENKEKMKKKEEGNIVIVQQQQQQITDKEIKELLDLIFYFFKQNESNSNLKLFLRVIILVKKLINFDKLKVPNCSFELIKEENEKNFYDIFKKLMKALTKGEDQLDDQEKDEQKTKEPSKVQKKDKKKKQKLELETSALEKNSLFFINIKSEFRKFIIKQNNEKKRLGEGNYQNNNIEISKEIIQIFLRYLELRKQNQLQNVVTTIKSLQKKYQEQYNNGNELNDINDGQLDLFVYNQIQLIINGNNVQSLLPLSNLPEAKDDKKKTLFEQLQSIFSGTVKTLKNIKNDLGSGVQQGQRVSGIPPLEDYYESKDFGAGQKLEAKSEKSEFLLFDLLKQFMSQNDYQLNLLILKLIFHNYSQCQMMLKSVKWLQVLTDEQEIQIFQKLQRKVKRFSFLCEKSEMWFIDTVQNQEEQKSQQQINLQYRSTIDQQQKNQIYKALNLLIKLNLLFFVDSLPQLKDQFNRIRYSEKPMKEENEKVKMSRQFIMRHQDVHRLVIQLLREGFHLLRSKTKFDKKCEILKVFIQCFGFLRFFCLNGNKSNKKILYSHMKDFEKLMSFIEVGQTDLINEIFKDNYKACSEVNDHLIHKYLHKITHKDAAQGFGGHHPRYLQFFERIIYFKNYPVKNNMKKVLDILLDFKKFGEVLYLKPKQELSPKLQSQNLTFNDQVQLDESLSFKQSFNQFQNNNNNLIINQQSSLGSGKGARPEMELNLSVEGVNLDVDVPYVYHAKLIKIILDILEYCDSSSKFLKSELRRHLPSIDIIKQLNQDDCFNACSFKAYCQFELNQQLSKLFMVLWADQENNQNIYNKLFTSPITTQFIQREIDKFNKLIKNLTDNQQDFLSVMPSLDRKNGDIFQKIAFMIERQHKSNQGDLQMNLDAHSYTKYFFGNALPIMHCIFKINNNMEENNKSIMIKELETKMKNCMQQLNKHLLDNPNSQKVFQDVLVQILHHKEILSETNKLFDVNLTIDREGQKEQYGNNAQGGDNASGMHLNEELSEYYIKQIDQQRIEEFINYPLQNLLSSKSLPEKPSLGQKLSRIFLLTLITNKSVKKILRQERKNFIYCLHKLDDSRKQQDEQHQDQDIKIDQLLQKFVQYSNLAFRQFVQNQSKENQSILIEILRFLTDFLSFSKNEDLIKYQNILNRNQLTRILLDMLCAPEEDIDYRHHYNAKKIFKCVVMLFTKLLHEGNQSVQKSAYEFFINDPSSERFFELFSNIINDYLGNQQLSGLIFEQVEQDLDDINLVYRSADKQVNLIKILKLIQLFCENHNDKLQNYLRHQIKSRNNYNLVNQLVRVLDKLVRFHNENTNEIVLNINRKNQKKIMQCMDTLIEFIQGPCKLNQTELAEGKFLEIATEILQQKDISPQMLMQNSKRQSAATNNNSMKNEGNPNQTQQKKSINIEMVQQGNYSELKDYGDASENRIDLQKQQKQLQIQQQQQKKDKNKFLLRIQECIEANLEQISMSFKNIVKKKFNQETSPEMVSQVKYKVLVCLESILEGNVDQTNLRKMMKVIPQKTLKLNLCKIFSVFSDVYKLKYTENVFMFLEEENKDDNEEIDNGPAEEEEEEDDDEDEKKSAFSGFMNRIPFLMQQEKEKKLIIENGFKIFYLMIKYNQVEKSLEKEDRDDDQSDEKNEDLTGEQDNVLGNLGEAGVDILRYLFGFIDNIFQYVRKCFQQQTDRGQENQQDDDYIIQKYYDDATKFFQKQTIHIEILFQQRHFTTYFPKLPQCEKLSLAAKDNFLNNVDRMSAKSKITGLVDKSKEIIIEMGHEYTLSQKYETVMLMKIFAKNFESWKNLSFYIAVLQNIFILMLLEGYHNLDLDIDFLDIAMKNNQEKSDVSQFGITITEGMFKQIQDILRYMQIVFSSLVAFLFLRKQLSLLRKLSNHEIEKHKKQMQENNWPEFKQTLFKMFMRIQFIAFDQDLLYYLGYIACSVVGLFNPVFTSLLLLDIFRRYPLLKQILNSLWRPRKQILLTMVLFIMMTYFFSLIFYFNFYQDITPLCDSLWKCFSIIIDLTFKSDGGYLGTFQNDYYDNWNFSMRVIYDFFYIFIIIVLISQIISGIIIDTFTQLREEHEQKEKDKKEKCFICGENLDILEKQQGGFKHHTENIHQIWNYIYYIAYLERKSKTDLSGFESYVYQMIQNKDITWFPKAITLIEEENQEKEAHILNKEDEDNGFGESSNQLQNNIQEIDTKSDEVDRRIQIISDLITHLKSSFDQGKQDLDKQNQHLLHMQ